MIRLVAKPVDQYINEEHVEDCNYFMKSHVPFPGCEIKEQIKDEDKLIWEEVSIT